MELKEFGCNLNTYNPYAQNDMPQFRDEKTKVVLKFLKAGNADTSVKTIRAPGFLMGTAIKCYAVERHF